jgi:hypothetical protein
MSYNLSRNNSKYVGNDDEQYARDYPPLILKEILI